MSTLYILGGGTPTPTPDRFGSSYVIELDDHKSKIMFDCGPAATDKLVKAGLWPTDIDYLFFTHHHFDHDVDYPCFLLCRWDQSVGSENTLKVFGPKPTEKLTHDLIGENGAFAHDWKARINAIPSQHVYVNRGGTLPRNPPTISDTKIKKPWISPKDIVAGDTINESNWTVETAVAEHVQPYLDSIAYKLTANNISIVFTGDTQPCESVTNLAKNADIMVCMCWDDQESMDKYQESTGQCSAEGAAKMAKDANVKKLVLSHMGKHISTHGVLENALGNAAKIFDGEIVFAEELMKISF